MARFCTTCGTPRSGGARFCTQCGAAFAVEEHAVEEPAVEEPAVEEHAGEEPPVEAVEVEQAAVPEPMPEPMPEASITAASPEPDAADTGFDIFPHVYPDPVVVAVTDVKAEADADAEDASANRPPVPVDATPPSLGMPSMQPVPSMPTSPHADVAPDLPPSADPYGYTPPPTPNRTPMMMVGIAVAALVVAGLAWWAFSDIEVNGIHPDDKGAEATVTADATPEAGPAVADIPYADSFLSLNDEPMVTRGAVALLPLPGQSAAAALRTLPEGAPIIGRWVRGQDGTSRWFRINSGGYLPESAVIAAAPPPPRTRAFDMHAAFGAALSSYFAIAGEEQQRMMQKVEKEGGSEGDVSGYAAVPGRNMYGLTVSGVATHYEGSSIIFRDDVTAVRNAFRAAGWQVNSSGDVMVGPQDGETCSINSTAQWPQSARLGASAVSCGV